MPDIDKSAAPPWDCQKVGAVGCTKHNFKSSVIISLKIFNENNLDETYLKQRKSIQQVDSLLKYLDHVKQIIWI